MAKIRDIGYVKVRVTREIVDEKEGRSLVLTVFDAHDILASTITVPEERFIKTVEDKE